MYPQIRRASYLIEQAEATLEEASGVIANGYLRLDPQEWLGTVEKRFGSGSSLSREELERIGAHEQRRSQGGWRSAGGIASAEDDLEMSAETAATLRAVVRLGSRERLEFLA